MTVLDSARPAGAGPVPPANRRTAGGALVVLAVLALLPPAGGRWAAAQDAAVVTLCRDPVLLERMAAMEERLVGENLGRIRLLERHGGDRAETCRDAAAADLTLGPPAQEWTGYDRQGMVTRWTARPATGPEGDALGLAILPADPAQTDRRW